MQQSPMQFAGLSQLACPACYGDLRLDASHLVCVSCARTYPVVDGIPVLIAGRAGSAKARE